MNYIAVILMLAVLGTMVEAKTISGSVKTTDNWKLLEDFCFDESGGRVEVKVINHIPDTTAVMAFYSDGDQHWGTIDDHLVTMSCREKMEAASTTRRLTDLETPTAFKVVGVRPRWWYIAVSSCDGPVDMEYTITFTNLAEGWSKHFGYDEQGVHQISIAFIVIQFILLLGTIWILGRGMTKRMNTKVPMVLVSSCLAEHLAIFFLLLHLSVYAVNGVGVKGLEDSYVYFDMFAQLLFLATIFLLIKGYPNNIMVITRSQIGGMTLYAINVLAYLVLFVYYVVGWTVENEFYIYDTPAGYVVVAARLATFCWAVWELYRTWKYEVNLFRRNYYVFLGLFVTYWFLYLPFCVLLSHFVAPWERKRVITGLVFSLNALAYLIPVLLFWPSIKNPYFNLLDTTGKIDSKEAQTAQSDSPKHVHISTTTPQSADTQA